MALPNFKPPKFDFSKIKNAFSGLGGKLNPSDALGKMKSDMLKGMKKVLTQETYSKAATKALAQALTIEVRPSGVRITANHPAWRTLIEGQKKQQMRWLLKSKTPIPIITETGKVIFRNATAKSMANGKWVHPGRPKGDFLDQARKYAHDFLQDRLGIEVKKQIQRLGK
jgi:NAD(P)-dependent dehydrogenase (short-subunit alcohol dehydrogenase family)